MGKSIYIRKHEIGHGFAKIVVPIVGETQREILDQTSTFKASQAESLEWRVDFFNEAYDFDAVLKVMAEIRRIIGDKLLIFTWRTKAEGGQKEIEPSAYVNLIESIAASELADFIDVEINLGEATYRKCLDSVHAKGGRVIGSYHNFDETPSEAFLLDLLTRFTHLNTDLLKFAVMPIHETDVTRVFNVLSTYKMTLPQGQPLVAIAMGRLGVMTRLIGDQFGSAMTFASIGETSAPGQVSLEDLVSFRKQLAKMAITP